MSKSRTIPIVRDEKSMQEEAEQQQNELMADFHDFMFYSRLVGGMKRQQSHTKDVGLRYQNQALIDHITNTRQGAPVSQTPSQPQSRRNSDDVASTVNEVLWMVHNEEWPCAPKEPASLDEEMIFEMEI